MSSKPQDAFTRWAALQAWSTDPTNRLDERTDLAFWARVAVDYDAEALAARVPALTRRVCALIPTGASVLEMGAGTGAFTLPVAARASVVTALDYSPAMLRVLRAKLTTETEARIQVVTGRWEDTPVTPHDVVLAANAWYRIADLRPALTKFVAAGRQRGIVLWSIGRRPGPRPADYRPGPDYLHLVDGLFELDIFATVEVHAGVALIWWDRPGTSPGDTLSTAGRSSSAR
jgi:SAM-dependent methyltransferase